MRGCAWMLCLIGAITWSGPALAQEAANESATPFAEFNWARIPTGQDIARFYPPAAERAKVSGSTVISCGITAEGLLIACQVVEETPAGYGFGEAALKMSTIFKLRSTTKGGEPVAGRTVRIPIQMRVF